MLLARKGYRVLLVDKATFPSDTVSTHVIWPHGAEILDRWGLLDRLATTGCPPIGLNMIFDVGPFALRGGVFDANGGRGGFCPRRTILDKLLADAAVESGAELREAFVVEDLVRDGDRVAGIKGRSLTGGAVEERAKVVIGADGVHSMLAKAVDAPKYDAIPPLGTFYYSYFSGFEADDIEQYTRDYEGAACFPTHDGLTLLVGVWSSSRFKEIREDIEGSFRKLHAAMPSVADRMSRARREEKWVGTAGIPNCFRRPYGPGWALVGDAGYEKDPITAQGISDAFIDAEQLTEALHSGLSGERLLDEALGAWHASRDERAKPMFDLTCEFARLEPPPPEMQALFGALRRNQEATNQFFSAITGALPVPQFMNPENIGRIMAAAG
jgi:2-polyprenyl-6-methoxyphenol hydroxylase-like FAD-dependent oxidoreductase